MKRTFYYTDIYMLLSKEEKELEKIGRCLDIFEKNKDSVHIVWGSVRIQKKPFGSESKGGEGL